MGEDLADVLARQHRRHPHDGVTGLLVPYDESDPAGFESRFAAAVNEVVGDPVLATTMGIAGRERAVRGFGWDIAARRTVEIYRAVLG